MLKLGLLAFAVCCTWLPAATATAAPIAVFPLQELGEGRNDANLAFTRVLAERLAANGNEVIDVEAVIAFMANNRIRRVGHLETENIAKVRRELGAAFVLLGTISQRRERPEPSMGLILSLVRTSDARTIWTYADSMSTGEERRVLGIGEPRSTAKLQPLLLDAVSERWPWRSINGEQQPGALNIDTVVLEPASARPGQEVHVRVRLRDISAGVQPPQAFFKVGDQLYPATLGADGRTCEATWVAGEENGRLPVTLLVEWPHYGRVETALLGSYLVDGTPPLFELELGGTILLNGIPVFGQQVVIFPRMLVRKPLARWRLAIYAEGDSIIGQNLGTGNLPGSFIWSGEQNIGDGVYRVEVEVWDQAGNTAKASKRVEMNRSLPQVALALDQGDEETAVGLAYEGKVPLKYWRLEMWTREGKILTQAEGKELPARVELDLPDSSQGQEVEGLLLYQDELGQKVRRKIGNLFEELGEKPEAKPKEEPAGVSEKWVDEF